MVKKFDGSKNRKAHGRLPITIELEKLIIQFAEENPSWGYDRIADALSNLSHKVSDRPVGNILKRNGIPPVPDRNKDATWATFIKKHQNNTAACDFITTKVITPAGLVTYYILFFIHHSNRKVYKAGITPHPNKEWMKQMARNITMANVGFLSNYKYLIHDRDS